MNMKFGTRIRTALLSVALTLTMLLAAAPAAHAAQPTELTGAWQGKLAVDAKTSLTIQFTFAKDAKGAVTAVLDSPDNGAIKNVAASGVSWDGSSLKLQVPSLSGSYAGSLKDGKLNGQWTQPGGTLPLVLSPYQKPVLTKQAIAQLNGGWFGTIALAGSNTTVQFTFKTDDKGALQGTFAIPDQGLVDVPVEGIEFTSGELSLRVPRINAQYKGKLANNQFAGKLQVPSPAIPAEGVDLALKRGEYAPPTHALKLSSADFAALGGKWQGKLEIDAPTGQHVSLTIVLRFATNANGQFIGFLDSPDQKAKDIPITEAGITNGKVVVKIEAVRGDFQGTLSGNTMTGTWTQLTNSTPLTLTRQQ